MKANSAGETLRAYWLSKGLVLPSGTTEQEIRDFEGRYRVNLAGDFRDYFLQVDGMSTYWPNAQDKEGYSFWPLRKVKSVSDEATISGNSWRTFPEAGSLFLFADYLDWSWAYAIRLLSDPLEGGRIFIIGKQETPIEVADSFSRFVELYLVDSPVLYGP